MFHSSSSRHEQYLIRSNASRATLHKKRSSLESEISGADSGYTSSSSTPSSTSPTTATACSPTTTIATASTENHVTTANHDVVTVMPPPTVKKKKSKRHQPPRQPDLVYSCPRPLAFPFHNDDHFLPIAEADPRDVARVSPSLNRSSSLQSSKMSIGSTRMYENYSCSGNTSQRGLDTESSYSHQSSILSTIQRGTVRSIRSLFQLPESQSHSRDLSRVQTNNTTKTNYTGSASSTHPPLQKLEIKKGTVQSIKDMFTLKRSSNIQVQHVTQPPPRQQKGRVGTTIGQFESSSSASPINYSRASVAAAATACSKKNNGSKPPTAALKMNVTPPAPSQPKSLKSRAAEFASRAIWKPKEPKLPTTTAYTTPATKPLPKDPTDKKTLKSEVKKISARVMALPKKWTSTTATAPPVSLPVPVTEAPKTKRSLFSSFRRSDVSASVDSSNHKKKGVDVATTQDEITPPRASTTVGKMWKSFKSLVTGKKASRIGVL